MATLNDYFQVKGRYYRSVQLVKDARSSASLAEYILTPTARQLAEQLLDALLQPMGQRAWSITGPYGTGKSAFALFLYDLLCQKKAFHPEARRLREQSGWRGGPFLPMLLVGQRTSLRQAILLGLADSIRDVDPLLSKRIKSQASRELNSVSLEDLLGQVVEAAKAARYGGLLIILDEFGKFLEHAASHPETEDLLVLQQLAESATRNAVPVLFVTILHTAFAEYLHTANQSQRLEWQKVQGRFTDVTFLEPPEQLLRLVGAAISRDRLPKNIDKAYGAIASKALQAPVLREPVRRLANPDVLPQCLPLHPITALLLWPLFRSKLAQNERSLFAFLTSSEPSGFQSFLAQDVDSETPVFTVDQLYDYVTLALGVTVYTGDHARRWSEITNALDRVPGDAPALSSKVIKTVGLLRLYGQAMGVSANAETVRLLFTDDTEVDQSLKYLAEKSILVFRKYDGAYALWEGSDVNLDDCYEQALRHISEGDLALRLQELIPLRPMVARRHYIHTGTLRYFDVRLWTGDAATFHEEGLKTEFRADGELVFVLTVDAKSRQALITLAIAATTLLSAQKPQLFAFPKPVVGLNEAVRHLEAWSWACENTPALQSDPVARREAQANLKYAQEQLEDLIGLVFGLAGHSFDPSTSDWVYNGYRPTPHSAKEFAVWLSTICGDIYVSAPTLRNELLNRGELSSAASAARRSLLQAMLAHPDEAQLGMAGTPPEVSMYRSLLLQGGFHRKQNDKWEFGVPRREWKPVWTAMLGFLKTTEAGRRPVQALFDLLKAPPFGLRDGPLPVLLCALLAANPGQLALYEEGLFVPELRIEVLERFMRAPHLFEIQQYALAADELRAIANIQILLQDLKVGQSPHVATDPLLQIVKDLTVFAARLPAYTKNTRRITPSFAVNVRDALLKARDPYALLKDDLPAAVGMANYPSEQAAEFLDRLRQSILGLQGAYPALLDEIEQQVRQVFRLSSTSAEARDALRSRAIPLNGLVAERTLSLFVRETMRLSEVQDWRLVMGRVVGEGLPPHQWHDANVTNFQVKLVQLASDFVRLEELAAEKQHTGAAEVLRIGVLDGHLAEMREVIAITPERARDVDQLTTLLATTIGGDLKAMPDERRRTVLAALARVAVNILEKDKVRDGRE